MKRRCPLMERFSADSKWFWALHGILMGPPPTPAGSSPVLPDSMKLSSISSLLAVAGVAFVALGCTNELRDRLGTGEGPLDAGPDAGPSSNCPAGTYASDDGECEPCEVGTFCDMGSVEPQGCVEGTWDHDADPRTRCELWTNCRAGEYVMVQGSPSRDRSCVPCEDGRFSLDPNVAECSAWTDCDAGYYVRISGSEDSNQLCSRCPSGTFTDEANRSECAPWSGCVAGQQVDVEGSASADRQCESCPDNSYSTTANVGSCTPFRVCEPGTFVESAGTRTSDALCSGCPSGSYSSVPDADSCAMWTDCQPGEFVSKAGSATEDRSCEMCPEDTYSIGLNSGACVAVGDCPPGTVVQMAATETTPAECNECSPGEYCAGGDAAAVECGYGDWDDDEDPATPCIAQTMCAAGEYIATPGDAVTDRSCAACPDGTFSEEPQSPSCAAWQHCAPGSYVVTPGTSIVDRGCEACSGGTFTEAEDESACASWSECSAPSSYVTTEPSASRDRECGLCEAPEVTLEDNASECILPVFQMNDGRVVMEAESFHAQERHDSEHSWELTTAPAASGERCMDLSPDVAYQWPSSAALGFAPRLDFRVNFTSTGTFFIHLRGDPGSGGGGSDSCFAGIDDTVAPVYDFDDQAASWSWRLQGINVSSAGQHTVSIWGSEDGFCLDKIVVSSSSTSPTGTGPAESPQE